MKEFKLFMLKWFLPVSSIILMIVSLGGLITTMFYEEAVRLLYLSFGGTILSVCISIYASLEEWRLSQKND